MRRVIDSIWKPTLAIVCLSSLPVLFLMWDTTPYGRASLARCLVQVAGSAAIGTSVAWWMLVARKAQPEREYAAAAGALGGFTAYFVPLVLWGMDFRKHQSEAGLAGVIVIVWVPVVIGMALVMAGICALVGRSLAPEKAQEGSPSRSFG